MNEPLELLLAATLGLMLGVLFFGGLWWTIRKALSSRQPALWFLGSLLLRLGTVLVGFYVVSGSHWERLLACLLGFIVARAAVTRLMKAGGEPQPPRAAEADHAT